MALVDQNQYATPQGYIHGAWWDIAETLGADAKTVASDDDIKASLKNYEDAILALVNMSDKEETWSVIGNVNGDEWKTDYKMTVIEDGVWESDYLTFENAKPGTDEKGEPITISATEFVLRRGADWNFKIGAVDDECTALGAIRWNGGDDIAKNINFSFFGLEDGFYKVRLTWDGSLDSTPVITLIPRE